MNIGAGAEDARCPDRRANGTATHEMLIEDGDFPVEDEDVGTELDDGGGDLGEPASVVDGISTQGRTLPASVLPSRSCQKSGGVCPSSITHNLVQRQNEREDTLPEK